MLSEKGLLIIEKLAEHNNELVTSKALAASTGMSERSVKTYLKEVADFCEQNSMTLDRKPGKGMKPCFSDAQIGKILDVAGRKSAAVSQKKRQNYISYIFAKRLGYIHVCAFFGGVKCQQKCHHGWYK